MYRDIIRSIEPLDQAAMEKCQLRLDNLTKPLGSLHALEHLACQMAGITCQGRPNNLAKSIIIMAADHEVGLAQGGSGQTAEKVAAVCQDRAVVNTLARHAEAALTVVDVGVRETLPPLPGLVVEKARAGARNLLLSPALTRAEVEQAINVGVRTAERELAKGVRILGIGAIGAGSDIAALAIANCYGADIEGDNTAGSSQVLARQALAMHQPNIDHPLDVLTKFGGLETAALVGVILGGAAGRAAIVLDGLTTAVAALLAVKLEPKVRSYLVGSHFSAEPAFKEVLRMLDLPAYLHLNMKFGDGAGAALGMTLIDGGLHVLNDMKTFAEAQVAVAQDGPGSLKQRLDIEI